MSEDFSYFISWPILWSNLLYKMGQDFLDTKYITWKFETSETLGSCIQITIDVKK